MLRASRVCLTCILTLFASANTFAQTTCDASIINAMRTYFKSAEDKEVALSVKQAVCQSQSNGTSLNIPYVGFTNEQVSQACSTNDMSFFQKHYKEISISMVPKEGFETLRAICLSNGITMTASKSGNDVSISAMFNQQNNQAPAKVSGLYFTRNIESCTGNLVPKGNKLPQLGTGGLNAVCSRKSGEAGSGDVVFLIATNKGSQQTKLFEAHHFTLLGYYGDDWLKCSIDGQQVLYLTAATFKGVNQAPEVRIDLDSYLSKPGDHKLHCESQDLIGIGSHACWKYKFELLRDDKLISSNADYCCSDGCPKQPAPIPDINIDVLADF